MNICKNICDDMKAIKNLRAGMYLNGFKYCSQCDCFFKTFENFCLCCGTHLRNHPRKKTLTSSKIEGMQ